MTAKKVPLRMCLGCNDRKSKKELIRVVKSPEGEFSIDFTGKKNGRGAYICSNEECFAKAKKAKRFERQFESPIPEEIYDRLLEELNKNG